MLFDNRKKWDERDRIRKLFETLIANNSDYINVGGIGALEEFFIGEDYALIEFRPQRIEIGQVQWDLPNMRHMYREWNGIPYDQLKLTVDQLSGPNTVFAVYPYSHRSDPVCFVSKERYAMKGG